MSVRQCLHELERPESTGYAHDLALFDRKFPAVAGVKIEIRMN